MIKQAEEQPILSLDIGHDSVKALMSSVEGRNVICHKAASVHFPKNQAGPSLGECLRVLKETFAAWSFKRNALRIALSGESITVRFIEVPPITKQQLLANISYESGKYIPFPLKDTYFDCDVFPAAEGKKEKATAVIAAVKRDSVSDLAKLLHGLGYSAELLDVSPLALFNAMERFGVAQARQLSSVAFLDIGSRESHFGIVHEGVPSFSRTLDVAGHSFTQAVAKALGVDEEKAEAEKRKAGASAGPALADVFHHLATEVRHSFEFFETERGAAVKGMLLTGGGALTPGLSEALAQSLETPVWIWNPMEDEAVQLGPDAPEGLKSQGPLFTGCLGLAGRTVAP